MHQDKTAQNYWISGLSSTFLDPLFDPLGDMKIYELFNIFTSKYTELCQKCLENKELLNFLLLGMDYFSKLKLSLLPSARGKTKLWKGGWNRHENYGKLAFSQAKMKPQSSFVVPSVQTNGKSCTTENETRAL